MKQGWDIKKLNEVVEFQRGLTYSKKDEVEFSNNVVLRSNNVDLKTNKLDFSELKYIDSNITIADNKKVKKGTLIICTANGSKNHLGKVALIDDDYDFAFGGFMGLIIPKEFINPIFLFHLLTSDAYKKFINGLSDGANINNLKFGDLGEFEIPIPPLPEQHRIIAILDDAFAKIDKAKANAEQNLKNAKELFESYLQRVFNEKVNGEEYSTLIDLCELIVDCEHKTAPIQETGYPSIRTPNIGKGHLLLENVNRVSFETYIEWTKRAVPKAGDLILAREAPAGNIAVIPDNIEVCLGQRTVLIRPKKDKFLSMYLAYLILSKDVQRILLSHSTGATVQHINMKDIRAFKIFNLSNLKEQEIIVRKLNSLSEETKKLEAIYEQKIKDLEELKKSVLQKAFSGEL
jgi:type I restriction enzyme S subunit